MQSKKRFRETFIWDADWFMRLSDSEKLFWFYINDQCDNIGVWEPNLRLAQFHIGSEIDVSQFFERVNRGKERLTKRPDDSWLLTGFVKFQYARSKPLNPKSPAHKSYLDLMKERNLVNWFIENYPEVMEEALDTNYFKNSKRGLKEVLKSDKDKETDKAKDMEADKDKPQRVNGLKAETILKAYPKKNDVSEIALLSDIGDVVKQLETEGINNPESYLLEEIDKLDRKKAPNPSVFFSELKQQKEVPF
jgi:hypothetical protein